MPILASQWLRLAFVSRSVVAKSARAGRAEHARVPVRRHAEGNMCQMAGRRSVSSAVQRASA